MYILKDKLGVRHVVTILDDFLFLGSTKQECLDGLNKFLELCKLAEIPIAQHKTEGPCTCLVFLGVQLDTRLMLAQLPPDKLIRYGENVTQAISKIMLTLRELQSIIGQLQYSTSVVTPGKAFIRRLINLTIGCTVPHYYVKLNEEAIRDLVMWSEFLKSYNGKSFLYGISRPDSSLINMYSDASGLGLGATYGS